jgi:CRP-like cAMP-binding protein
MADRAAVLALPHTLKTIEPNRPIVREGDRTSFACVLLTGFAIRQKTVADGARQIFSMHLSGDIVDLQNAVLRIADNTAQALTRCQVAFVPREAIRRIAAERSPIGEALWYDTLVDGSIFREWIANVGRRDARMRVAHLLCEFAMRMQAAGLSTQESYELPMTQEQLADCTGLTPVHVNRMLMILSEEGLITRTKRSVKINNWHNLASAGDFDSAYLHLDDARLAI